MTTDKTLYAALLQKIEALSKQQIEKFGDQITCHQGCDECCHPPDSLFQVEAQFLEDGICALSSEYSLKIEQRLIAYQKGERKQCPLLEDHKCLVYSSRPSICRTQGFALWLPSTEKEENQEFEDSSRMSWCSLNFTKKQASRIDALDVGRLNMMLSLMTQLGWKDQPARRNLIEIIQTGLSKLKKD